LSHEEHEDTQSLRNHDSKFPLKRERGFVLKFKGPMFQYPPSVQNDDWQLARRGSF